MEIEFNERDHSYKVDGVETPSVTTLQKYMHADTYAGVPKRILERKAEYGDRVHSLIENASKNVFPSDLDKHSYEALSLKRYEFLRDQYKIETTSCEQCIAYDHSGLWLFAGKYDMLGSVNGKTALIDIKTTEKLHTDLLREQLTMYKMAIEQMTGAKVEQVFCLWLPKKAYGNFIEIPVLDESSLIPRLLDAYRSFFEKD